VAYLDGYDPALTSVVDLNRTSGSVRVNPNPSEGIFNLELKWPYALPVIINLTDLSGRILIILLLWRE